MKKTNKTFKRFAAITSASLLAACAMAPMFTSALELDLADPTKEVSGEIVSLLPEGTAIQETVSAYQVFTLSKVGELYNVTGWGTGVNPKGIVDAITSNNDFLINVEGSDVNAFNGITLTETATPEQLKKAAEDVGVALTKLSNAQNEAFAKIVMNNLTAASVDGTYSAADDKVTFETIENGYYIVSCLAAKTGSADYFAKSLGMLTIVDSDKENGDIGLDGVAKIGLPKVEKKVKENQEDNYKSIDNATFESDDKSWNDVADYGIGDAVPFKLYGTMPDDIDNYGAYYYCFNDTLDSQFDHPTNVEIKIGSVKTLKVSVDVQNNNGTNVYTYTVEGDIEDNCSVTFEGGQFKVAFKDIKKYDTNTSKVDKNTLVTVEYKSVLNSTANIGKTGQDNEVYLEYSNNPNLDYNPWDTSDENDTSENGETPKDEVRVHTYAFKMDKTFFNAQGGNITAAEIESGAYNAAKFMLTPKTGTTYFIKLENDSNYDYYAVNNVEKPANAVDSLLLTEVGGQLVIRIKGLDEGTYTLTEIEAPGGFNKAAPQEVYISASTANGQTWGGTGDTLSKFEYSIDDGDFTSNDAGIASASMRNNQGTTLPGTGGIGTTIFYLGGGAMAAIGGIYLISKRRMRKSEE